MEKIFYSIAEVAEKTGLEKHVVRFWESEFSDIKPDRRQGRRYFRDSDIKVILRIKDLLYKQGFTIKGAKKVLHSKNPVDMSVLEEPSAAQLAAQPGLGRKILAKFSFGGESFAAAERNGADSTLVLKKLMEIDDILKG
jgi:DNA-binding transcriptional MerR regulator